MVTPLLTIFENRLADNFRAVLKAALDNRLEFLESGFLSRMVLLMSEILRDPELKNFFHQTLFKPLFKRMSGIFGTQFEHWAFPAHRPRVIVRLVGGMMIGMSHDAQC